MVTMWPSEARPAGDPAIRVGPGDLGGVVTSAKGPEAGVWVIAETTDLPTKFAKIVVTDDRGRYLIPDLPRAAYRVWVRGYGLVDSPKVRTVPGKTLDLKAVAAPSAKAAAEYYPPVYWYSMLKIPEKSLFPGTGPGGNGMPETLPSQAAWLNTIKTTGCMSCHAIGTKGTRTIPKELGHFNSGVEAWTRRIVVRAGHDPDGQCPRPARLQASHRAVRGLDGSDRRRRAALRAAGPAARS